MQKAIMFLLMSDWFKMAASPKKKRFDTTTSTDTELNVDVVAAHHLSMNFATNYWAQLRLLAKYLQNH